MSEHLVPSVEDALEAYDADASVMHCYRPNGSRSEWRAGIYHYACMQVEAASVRLDMAMALESERRIRASIAWA